MSRRALPPQPSGDNWHTWARQLVEYLQVSDTSEQESVPETLLLRHQMDAQRDKAIVDGIMMFSPSLGAPVFSLDGSWVPLQKNTGLPVTTFIGLTDTPSSYASNKGQYLRVNSQGTALEYVNLGTPLNETSANDLYISKKRDDVSLGNLTIDKSSGPSTLTLKGDAGSIAFVSDTDTMLGHITSLGSGELSLASVPYGSSIDFDQASGTSRIVLSPDNSLKHQAIWTPLPVDDTSPSNKRHLLTMHRADERYLREADMSAYLTAEAAIEYFMTTEEANDLYVAKAGDTMTGALTINDALTVTGDVMLSTVGIGELPEKVTDLNSFSKLGHYMQNGSEGATANGPPRWSTGGPWGGFVVGMNNASNLAQILIRGNNGNAPKMAVRSYRANSWLDWTYLLDQEAADTLYLGLGGGELTGDLTIDAEYDIASASGKGAHFSVEATYTSLGIQAQDVTLDTDMLMAVHVGTSTILELTADGVLKTGSAGNALPVVTEATGINTDNGVTLSDLSEATLGGMFISNATESGTTDGPSEWNSGGPWGGVTLAMNNINNQARILVRRNQSNGAIPRAAVRVRGAGTWQDWDYLVDRDYGDRRYEYTGLGDLLVSKGVITQGELDALEP